MEKKPSPRPRGSHGILPKSPLVYEKYKAGCIWRLKTLFEFRQARSGTALRSRKPHELRDSAGNFYTKSQLELLRRLHEKCQLANNETAKPQNILEEGISCKPKTKRRCDPDRKMRRLKHVKEEGPDKRNRSSVNLINLDVRMNEEALMCKKADKKRDKGNDHQSKQLLEALDILSSNKELFVTLFEDPNSFSKDKSSSNLDEIVLLKPRVLGSDEDSVSVRFKRLAKKLKLVGTDKNNQRENTSLRYSIDSDEATKKMEKRDFRMSRSSDLSVFKQKKRVESDVFELNTEYDVLPKRFSRERRYERTSPLPVYEVPRVLSTFEMRFKERDDKQSYRSRSAVKSFDSRVSDFSVDDLCRGNLRPKMEEECEEQRYFKNSCMESCSDNHMETQEQEHPSPVSVLSRTHMEDEILSPAIPGHPSISKPRSESEEQICLFSDRGSVEKLVKKVLESSGLNSTKCSANNGNDCHRLVVDYTSEILDEIYRQDLKPWPYMAREAMKRLDWSLLCDSDGPRTLDRLMERDLTKKPCLWSDFGGESEGVVADVVEQILEQLEMEIIHELGTIPTRRSKFLRAYSRFL